MAGSHEHPVFKHINVYKPKMNLTSRVTNRETGHSDKSFSDSCTITVKYFF